VHVGVDVEGSKTASVALLLSGLSLGDCATSTAARAEETAAPRQGVYPQVQDLPPKPEKPVMTADERAKLLNELTAARDRQTSAVKAREGGARPKPIKPEKAKTP
jgi:hypothetical protein